MFQVSLLQAYCKFSVCVTMPRVYKHKGAKNQWTDEQLEEARRKKVKDKELSFRTVVQTYGIPCNTLSDHISGVNSKRYWGCTTILSPAEENDSVVPCQVLAKMGFPLTKDCDSSCEGLPASRESKSPPWC